MPFFWFAGRAKTVIKSRFDIDKYLIKHGHNLYQGTVDDLKAKHPGEDLEAIFIKMIGETLE